MNGNLEQVRRTYLKGIDLNKKYQLGETALYYSSRKGYTEIVRFLLSKNADPNLTTDAGTLPIHAACWKGHLPIVKELLPYLHNIDVQNNKHSTPMSFALSGGHIEIVRILIKHGANVNYRYQSNLTLLHSECNRGNLEMVQLLVSAGADINATVSEEISYPMQFAVSKGYAEIVSFLIKNGSELCTDNISLLTRAVYNKHFNVVKILIDAGANLHQTDPKYGQQAIHKAAAVSTEEIINLLIAHDADLNAVDNSGLTPLHLASVYNNHSLAKILLQHGANVKALSKKKLTPLKLAKDDLMKNILSNHEAYAQAYQPSAPPMQLAETGPSFPSENSDIESNPIKLPSSIALDVCPKPCTSPDPESDIQQLEDQLNLKVDELKKLRIKCGEIESEISELNTKMTSLKIAASKSKTLDSRYLECPICFEVPMPPIKIFQCEQGHIFCEECKNQGIRNCPECRCSLDKKCIRNRRLEDVIREKYNDFAK